MKTTKSPDLRTLSALDAGHFNVPSRAALQSPKRSSKDKARQMADLALEPSFNAAAVAIEFLSSPGSDLSVTGMMASLAASIEDVRRGDLSHAEAMLFAQANALQAVFVEMARRAAKLDRLEHREASLRMALKAQNQCRMTLETLAAVKNPPLVIARQANISGGPQQVNNGVMAGEVAACTRARSLEEQNELNDASQPHSAR